MTTNREGEVVSYDVPVVRYKWKVNEPKVSINDKLKLARTKAETNAILEKAMSTFKDVSNKTKTQWKKTAKNRISQIQLEKS